MRRSTFRSIAALMLLSVALAPLAPLATAEESANPLRDRVHDAVLAQAEQVKQRLRDYVARYGGDPDYSIEVEGLNDSIAQIDRYAPTRFTNFLVNGMMTGNAWADAIDYRVATSDPEGRFQVNFTYLEDQLKQAREMENATIARFQAIEGAVRSRHGFETMVFAGVYRASGELQLRFASVVDLREVRRTQTAEFVRMLTTDVAGTRLNFQLSIAIAETAKNDTEGGTLDPAALARVRDLSWKGIGVRISEKNDGFLSKIAQADLERGESAAILGAWIVFARLNDLNTLNFNEARAKSSPQYAQLLKNQTLAAYRSDEAAERVRSLGFTGLVQESNHDEATHYLGKNDLKSLSAAHAALVTTAVTLPAFQAFADSPATSQGFTLPGFPPMTLLLGVLCAALLARSLSTRPRGPGRRDS